MNEWKKKSTRVTKGLWLIRTKACDQKVLKNTTYPG